MHRIGGRPKHVTKSLFLAGARCQAAGWYALNEAEGSAPSAGDLNRMREGQQVGERARAQFPGGVQVAQLDFDAAVAQTQTLMADPAVTTIFEAAFEWNGYAARADIISRGVKGGWIVTEVKSRLHDDDEQALSEALIVDLIYTVEVVMRSGVYVTGARITRIARDWRLGHDASAFFDSIEWCDLDIVALGEPIVGHFDNLHDAIMGPERPSAPLKYACRECPYFETVCHARGIENTVFSIPRLGAKKFEQLAAAGILNLLDVPNDFALSEKQARVLAAARGQKPIAEIDELRSMLGEIRWPAVYLDFETVKGAVPFWPNVAPHEQVVTQYSVHVCDAPGRVVDHFEYLADHTQDCRLQLAELLLRDLAGEGSIVVYSSFEKTTLNGLARRFPQLEQAIAGCVSRLFDFEKVFGAYCHPGFQGRTSIKKTLPVLVPGMSYANLNIADGDSAVAMFAQMARGECSDEMCAAIRADLLEYCGQDTLAMVKLHEALHRLAHA